MSKNTSSIRVSPEHLAIIDACMQDYYENPDDYSKADFLAAMLGSWQAHH